MGQNNQLYYKPTPEAAVRTLRELASRGALPQPPAAPKVSVVPQVPKYPPFQPENGLEVDQLVSGMGLGNPRPELSVGGPDRPSPEPLRPEWALPEPGVRHTPQALPSLAEAGLSRFGVGSRSPLGGTVLGAQSAARGAMTSPSRFGSWLTSDPEEPTPGPYSRQAAIASGQIQPLTDSPYRNQPNEAAVGGVPANDPLKGGSMSFKGSNPNLSTTPGALDNFAQLAKQFGVPTGQAYDPQFEEGFAGNNTGPGISSEELWKQAGRDPASMAPGAGQWARSELADRTGDTEFERGVKMLPATVAGITQGGGIEQQKIQSQGLKDVANINQGGLSARYGALTDLMAGGGLAPGARLTMPGGGGITMPQSKPPFNQQTLSQLSAARLSGNEQYLSQAIGNALGQYQGDPDVASLARHIMSSPALKASQDTNKILQALSQEGLDLGALHPEEIQELDGLLYTLQGRGGN